MRRRLLATTRRRDDDARVLPLINVVFLLLIFFMLAGKLSSGDPFKIEPPNSAKAAAAEESAPVVLLAADGRLALDGQPTTLEDLPARLADRDASATRLKADAATDTGKVIEVMQALHAAGVSRVRLLTVAGDP